MRIAISGTHSQGKSTFVRDFLDVHPDYAFENEPYRELMHEHEILFGDHQTQNHIDLQLNHCIEHVQRYQQGDKVIFDRAPTDFIPYSDYTAKNAHTDIDDAYVTAMVDRVKPVMEHLDLIVFVPKSKDYEIVLEDDGHRPVEDFYRDWVDEGFKEMYRNRLTTVIPIANQPRVIEITGPREERIRLLNEAIDTFTNKK